MEHEKFMGAPTMRWRYHFPVKGGVNDSFFVYERNWIDQRIGKVDVSIWLTLGAWGYVERQRSWVLLVIGHCFSAFVENAQLIVERDVL
jgi:hypothetical protein